MRKDALDDMIEARTETNAAFPELLATAEKRHKSVRAVRKASDKRSPSQKKVAAKMPSATRL